jgi:hypothetical protein
LMVLGSSNAPREMPMITECTSIPSSKTYTINHYCWSQIMCKQYDHCRLFSSQVFVSKFQAGYVSFE